MDPFSIAVGASQIAGACIQCTVTIIKFCSDINTVDVRIKGFYDEVVILQATYEGLEKSLGSPIMLEAARVANKTNDGAHLWQQVRIALDDSLRTIGRINKVLDDISKKTGFARRLKTTLAESLKDGELHRLRQRVQFFNATISLPIQLVGVQLQLEQRGMSAEHQRSLDAKFMSLERQMRQLIANLSQPDRVSRMYSGSTLLVGTADKQVDFRGKESYLSFAKKILSTASAAASTRSTMSTISPQIDPPPLSDLGAGPVHQSLPDRRRSIPDWIPAPADTSSSDPFGHMHAATSMTSVPPEMPQPKGKSFEVAYKLAQTHLKLGQEKAERNEHESAEKSFKKALTLLEKHDFSGRIAFQPAEVVLMLSQSCLMQKKYDEAIELLSPVAEREPDIFPQSGTPTSPGTPPTPSQSLQRPDKLQALAASHMLGEAYRQKENYGSAIEHSLKAFMQRTDELGEHDEKTLESVRLLIDIYRAMDDKEEAEAYEAFLSPSPIQQVQRPAASSRESGEIVYSDAQTAVPSISPPPSEVLPPPQFQPRKTDRPSFTSRLKNMGRPPQNSLGQPRPHPDPSRQSFSRTPTLDNTPHEAVFLNTRHLSSPSDTSHERTNSFFDDDSTAASSARLERSSSQKIIEPTFQAVSQLCDAGKLDKAVKIGLSFLQGYNSNVFIIRKDELEKNIRKGIGKGLASTGKGYSPLHYFCELREECVDEVGLLIKYGADVNAIAYKAGYTSANSSSVLSPLQLSIDKGHTQISRLLLETKGIKTDIKDGDGFVPLLAAMRKKQHNTVKLLLNHAPQCRPLVYPSQWYGNSLLHDAARHCDLTLVEILLEAGGPVDVNLRDKFGKTPLMHAILKNDVSNPQEMRRLTRERRQVVEALLRAGADGQIRDDNGDSARKYAEKEGGKDGEVLCRLVGGGRQGVA